MKILLVSEDDDLLYVLCYGLRRRGHEVISAAPGAHIPRLLWTERPALTVVDDAGSGRAELPASAEFRAALIPCILLTPRSDHLDARLRHGWDAVLPKPFRLDELIRVIEAVAARVDGEVSDSLELPGEGNID